MSAISAAVGTPLFAFLNHIGPMELMIILGLGVLLFGGVVYVARQGDSTPTLDPERGRQLVWAGRFLWVLVTAATIFAFTRFQRSKGKAGLQTWSIIGWALGETVALFGAVVWFMGATASWFVPGLVFFLITLVVFPSRPAP